MKLNAMEDKCELRVIRRSIFWFLTFAFVFAAFAACGRLLSQDRTVPTKSLAPKEARILIENLPDVRFARERFDRPVVEIVESSQHTVSLVARSTKTRGYASGL